MKTTLQILKDARQLISKPENWCQVSMAKTPEGFPTYANNPRACAFCTIGAITKVENKTSLDSKGYEALYSYAVAHGIFNPGSGGIGDYNDTHTHAEVLKLFDGAIESL